MREARLSCMRAFRSFRLPLPRGVMRLAGPAHPSHNVPDARRVAGSAAPEPADAGAAARLRASRLHRGRRCSAPRATAPCASSCWFCLPHVRDYNTRLGLLQRHGPERDRGRHLRSDTAWQRPTWPLGRLGGAGRFDPILRDPLGVLRDTRRRRPPPPRARTDEAPPELRAALDLLELAWPLDQVDLRSRYKELAKRHHPDATGGDRAAEERLKDINRAYSLLKRRGVRARAAAAAGRRRAAPGSRIARRPPSMTLNRHGTGLQMNKVAQISEIRPTSAIDAPDITVKAREVFGVDIDMEVPAFSIRTGARARGRPDLPVRPRHDAGDPRRLCLQPPRDDPGLSRHRQIDPYRAGRGAAELALHPRQPRQPHQPHRPDRQGRDRAARRQAGDRIPRRHAALGAAAPRRAGVRRIRRRPPGRDVRDPARAGSRRQADAARPEPGDPPATRGSACSPPPTRSAWATPPASITARSRSTRARWTAGTSSRR